MAPARSTARATQPAAEFAASGLYGAMIGETTVRFLALAEEMRKRLSESDSIEEERIPSGRHLGYCQI